MNQYQMQSRPQSKVAAVGRSQKLALLLFALVGVTLSAVVYGCVRSWEDSSLRAQVAAHAQERARLLETKILRSMEVLHSITALFATRDDVSRQDFHVFVAHALSQQPELLALGWTPIVPGSLRIQLEASARQDGLKDFHFTQLNGSRAGSAGLYAAETRPEYFPVYFIEPVERNRSALGFDLGSDPDRLMALRLAARTRSSVATAPIRLVQFDGNDNGDLGFVVYLPLYRSDRRSASSPGEDGPGEYTDHLAGYASAVFRFDDLLRTSAEDLLPQGLDLSVLDDAGNATVYFTVGNPARSGRPALSRESALLAGSAELEVGSRRWTLVLNPRQSFISAHRGVQAEAILFTGILITLLLTGFAYSTFARTAEIERRVVERTAQLSEEVTERRRAEQAARLAEAKYRGIFENSIEGIFQTTPDGRYISANHSLARIYGYDSIDHLISDLTNIASQLYVDPMRREQFVQRVHENGSVSDFESQIFRKDGTVIWICETARTVRDDRGEVLYYEGTVADITERKRAEGWLRKNRDELEARVEERTEQLARINQALQDEVGERKRAEDAAAAASRAKSTFLANMSHEIRTPMNAILGYAQILWRDTTVSERHREPISTILSSGNHLLSLINDVLDLSKIEAGCMELHPVDFDLCGLLADLSAMFRQKCRQKGLVLRVEQAGICPRQGRVIADARKLRQVLINLLGNAVKFTDAGSVTLRVSVEGTSADGAAAESVFRFEVEDTGPGIDPEARAQIFEPFQQARAGRGRGGTGLGLAIAREQIELMGGRLEVHSHPGTGAVFHFSLTLPRTGDSASLLADDPPAFLGVDWTAIRRQDEASEHARAAPVVVTEPIRRRLVMAARRSSITEIRRCLAEIERDGPAARSGAAPLLPLVQHYDMDGILKLLGDEAHEPQDRREVPDRVVIAR